MRFEDVRGNVHKLDNILYRTVKPLTNISKELFKCRLEIFQRVLYYIT